MGEEPIRSEVGTAVVRKTSDPVINNKQLDAYFSGGKLNSPQRLGYVMKMIKELAPLTQEEWREWYLENVHDEQYLEDLASELFRIVPPSSGYTYKDCSHYIYDVMFRRTFLGYNKEHPALHILRSEISENILPAPQEWAWKYYVDYYAKNNAGKIVGIHFKPEQYFDGNQQKMLAIQTKQAAFCEEQGGEVYDLSYTRDADGTHRIRDKRQKNEIRNAITPRLPRTVNIRKGQDLDFIALQKLIKASRKNEQRASFPFIVQARTGQKYIVWFTYDVDDTDDENPITVVDRVCMIARKGEITVTSVDLQAPFKFTGRQTLSYEDYLRDFAGLYKNFSVNKMNGLLWSKAYRPLYDAYCAVSAWARVAGNVEKEEPSRTPAEQTVRK